MHSTFHIKAAALVALALSTSVSSHSWVEELMVIGNGGSFVGTPGYPRAFVKRAAGVNPDAGMVHLLPPDGRAERNQILPSDPICMPTQQHQMQSDGSPRLKAASGDLIMMRYQENGHVTLPQTQQGKPANRGTIFIYGTTDPKPDDKLLSIHKVWNTDGSGGDKRGKLLATEPFDDGQCYQMNGGSISAERQAKHKHSADPIMGMDLWCQNNFRLPADAPSGKPYTIYWVWDWPTAAGTPGFKDGKNETYTTCIDIDTTGPKSGNGQGKLAQNNVVKFNQGQDINSAAIPAYMQALDSGANIMVPGTAPTGQPVSILNSAIDAAPPAGSNMNAPAAPQPPASPAAPGTQQPAEPRTSTTPTKACTPAGEGAGEKTVTVTAPGSEKTVTVTANPAANGTPTTKLMTTHSTVMVGKTTTVTPVSYVTKPTNAAGSGQATPKPLPPQPQVVSGVTIPTLSIGRTFSGTATANPLGPTVVSRSCSSCRPQKRSTIFGSAPRGQHAAAHIKARSEGMRHGGSAKFRAL
ncbi:MAG: hypothetical protein LQ351_001054 [Letrouitia transgressa]|nr:MAG: hypothetical protein LQ351_001054 [Letrouitia transgressa]